MQILSDIAAVAAGVFSGAIGFLLIAFFLVGAVVFFAMRIMGRRNANRALNSQQRNRPSAAH